MTINIKESNFLDSQDVSYNIGYYYAEQFRYYFDITAAAQAWVDGTADPNLGIIFKSTDEFEAGSTLHYRTFGSYNRDVCQPTMIVEYKIPGEIIIPDTYNGYLDEGDRLQLSTNMTGTVTWTSSDTTLATVSSYGYVTAIRAGQVTITASAEGYSDRSVTLWITLPDGLYYIKSAYTGYCLTASGYSSSSVGTYINTKSSSAYQYWIITYSYNGRYHIQPLHNINYDLNYNGSQVVTTDQDALTSSSYWTINYTSYGYAFKFNGYDSKTMKPEEPGTLTGATVTAASWTAAAKYHWNPEAVSGAFLRDLATGSLVDSSAVKHVKMDQSLSLANLGLNLERFGGAALPSWTTSNSDAVEVNPYSGQIQGMGTGQATITMTTAVNSVETTQSFTAICPRILTAKVQYDAGYLTRNADAVSRIETQMESMCNFFLEEFHVDIRYNTPTEFSSYADAYCYADVDKACDHGLMCTNSSFPANGQIFANTYHHKNISNILARTYSSSSTTMFTISYTGHNVCINSNGTHYVNNPGAGLGTSGVAVSGLGIILVAGGFSTSIEQITLIHEFGHLIGAPDHYDNDCLSTDEINSSAEYSNYAGQFNDNCIYGRNKDTMSDPRTLCPGCRAVIEDYLAALSDE